MTISTQPSDGRKPITDQTITLPIARIRIKRWLQAMDIIPQFKEKPELKPRAIYIDLADITELLKAYPVRELAGIRVYFGLAGENQPISAGISDIRGLLVPVIKTGDKYTDLITNPGGSGDPKDTSIYDFTAPCPVFCDKQSELYVKDTDQEQ